VAASRVLALRRIGALATLASPRPGPRTGSALRDVGLLQDAAVVSRDGRIVYVGPDRDAPVPGDATVIDAAGAAVIPGLVDAHTHLAFAGDRDDEIRRRLAGATYAEIAAEGGGIVRSVEATRAATPGELACGMFGRLNEMMLQGTTTVEIKSGYGLETGAEIRSLQAIASVAASHPVTIVSTFMGAHEVPLEHRAHRERYVELLIAEMIPEVARLDLAAFCDVFCEQGVFTIAESRRILEAARAHGLALRVHADELTWTGGGELAGEMGARSADHLVFASEAGMDAMAKAQCVATLLPAACFYLRLPRFAPARAMIDHGVAIAIASDTNPGGGLSPSLPFAMTVACFSMGLSLEEALTAATYNAACSLDVQDDVGSIEVGKRADLVLLRSARLLDLLRVGVPAIRTVVKDGLVVVRDGVRQ